MGKGDDGVVNLFCQEKMQFVQVPKSFLPNGVSKGGIVTISIARKTTEKDLMDKIIMDIQDSLLKCVKKNTKEESTK